MSLSELARFYRDMHAACLRTMTPAPELVTPDFCADYLANKNTRNRPYKSSWRAVKAAILARRWRCNGETVVLDWDDQMANGQNRFRGIVEAGVPVPLVIVRGADPSCFASYDQHSKRNGADALYIEGAKNCINIQSSLKYLAAYLSDSLPALPHLDNETVLGMYRDYPGIGVSVAWAKLHCVKGDHPPGMFAFLHFLLMGERADLAGPFFKKVVDGVGIAEGTHEFNLAKSLRGGRGVSRDENRDTLAIFIKAWNGVVTGERPKRLIWPASDDEPFPMIRLW